MATRWISHTSTRYATVTDPFASLQAKDGKKPRPRATLSCRECRRLKLKCDRTFPCSACRRRNCADICPDGMRKPPGRALEIQAEFSLLLKRIEFLESVVKDLGGQDQIPPPLQLQHALKRTTPLSKEVEAEIETASAGPLPHDSEATSDDGGAQDDEHPADTLEKLVIGVGSLRIGSNESGRYLGASGSPAYHFDEDDDDKLSAEEDRPPLTEGHPVVQLGSSRREGNAEIEHYRGLLPPLPEINRLAKNYFSFVAFQFTPLSPKEFYEDYLPAAIEANHPAATKLGAVYAVLSLGSLFDPQKPATFNEEAQRYFLRSQNILAAAKALSNNTLATSQAVQLAGSYLLCQHDLKEGGETFYPMLGIASRFLVTQALHRDGTLFGLSGEELNRRRRIFWELITIERMQAFIAGRPYMLQNSQFDTQMPENAPPFDVCKWQLGVFIARVIDLAFSIKSPSYSTILKLDEELRSLVRQSPASVRSGVLPPDAFVVKPRSIAQLPVPRQQTGATLIERLQQHTMDQMYSQVLFYLHKPAFAHALLNHPQEPLQSPYRASVEALSCETAVYLVAVAKSWITLDPVLAPRWWHIFFHAFAASVGQASLCIKAPRSVLAPFAWGQLREAVSIFETAGATGAPCSLYVPRLKTLQEKAYISLQSLLTVPSNLGFDGNLSEILSAGTDVDRSILNPPVRLERKQGRQKSSPVQEGVSPGSDSSLGHARDPSLPLAPQTSQIGGGASYGPAYSPFDHRFLHSQPLPSGAGPVGDAYSVIPNDYYPVGAGDPRLQQLPPMQQHPVDAFAPVLYPFGDPRNVTEHAYGHTPDTRLGFVSFATDFSSLEPAMAGSEQAWVEPVQAGVGYPSAFRPVPADFAGFPAQ
ncbi:uncharacterized protein JCM15063_004508 [Sporobolomyces koalae]|uniref:uncharacterized protein n=1 Tax=Sporobolomyces koalae TaxID=500713 RepID=UPI00316DB2D7